MSNDRRPEVEGASERESGRRPYRAPELRVHGDLREITRLGENAGFDFFDGSPAP